MLASGCHRSLPVALTQGCRVISADERRLRLEVSVYILYKDWAIIGCHAEYLPFHCGHIILWPSADTRPHRHIVHVLNNAQEITRESMCKKQCE